VTKCVVKPLRDVKVTGSKPARTKNPTMLRVGVAQAGYTQINKQFFFYKVNRLIK
jgi:hypothetical protein